MLLLPLGVALSLGWAELLASSYLCSALPEALLDSSKGFTPNVQALSCTSFPKWI